MHTLVWHWENAPHQRRQFNARLPSCSTPYQPEEKETNLFSYMVNRFLRGGPWKPELWIRDGGSAGRPGHRSSAAQAWADVPPAPGCCLAGRAARETLCRTPSAPPPAPGMPGAAHSAPGSGCTTSTPPDTALGAGRPIPSHSRGHPNPGTCTLMGLVSLGLRHWPCISSIALQACELRANLTKAMPLDSLVCLSRTTQMSWISPKGEKRSLSTDSGVYLLITRKMRLLGGSSRLSTPGRKPPPLAQLPASSIVLHPAREPGPGPLQFSSLPPRPPPQWSHTQPLHVGCPASGRRRGLAPGAVRPRSGPASGERPPAPPSVSGWGRPTQSL